MSKNLSFGDITPVRLSDRNVPLDSGNVDPKTPMALGAILMPLMFYDLSAYLMLLIVGQDHATFCDLVLNPTLILRFLQVRSELEFFWVRT